MSDREAARGNRDKVPSSAANLWRTEIALRVRELRHRLEAVCAAGEAAGGAEPHGDAGEAAGGAEPHGDAGEAAGGAEPHGDAGETLAVAAHVDARGLDVTMGRSSASHASPQMDAARRECHVKAVEQALDDADAAIELDRGLRHSWSRIHAWWTGQKITAAWEAVHRAEAELAEIGSDADALAALPQLRAWMRQVLTDRDQLAGYERAFGDAVTTHRIDRTQLRQAYQDAIAANVDWHASLRTFRNILFSVAAALTLLLLGLAVWHAANPAVVSLCRGAGRTAACFGEGTRPAGRALIEVLLVGAVGGLLSSAFLLGRMESAPTRYNLLTPQVVLKAVAGAATALVGVILVVSQIVVAPVGVQSTAALLAYAAVFGFSQQLLTQFVDRRGVDLLKPQQESSRARRA